MRFDWSLAVIFALVTFNLALSVLPAWHPGWRSAAGTWGFSLIAAALMFASLLADELAHAVVASPHLGAARLESVAETVAMFRALGPGATLLLWLGPLNVSLALFNLVPGFPLDGGRLLRAALWAATGDLLRATRWASGAGRLFAWFLMATGVMTLFRGNAGGGLWLLLIGWFLDGAALSSLEAQRLRHSLEGVPVSRLMNTRLERLAPQLSIERFVREYVLSQDQPAYPVEEGGRLVGLVAFEDVRRVPQDAWSRTPIGEVMKPLTGLPALAPSTEAQAALEVLARREVDQLPVVEEGRLLGLVSRKDLVRWLALHEGPRLA